MHILYAKGAPETAHIIPQKRFNSYIELYRYICLGEGYRSPRYKWNDNPAAFWDGGYGNPIPRDKISFIDSGTKGVFKIIRNDVPENAISFCRNLGYFEVIE